MKSVRFASLLCMPMLALGAFAYQGSAQQPAQAPQSSGAASQTSQQPDAATPGTASQTQPGSVQSPQGQTPQSESSQAPMRSGNPVDDQVSALTAALNLTNDQQAKVKSILVDQHQQALTFVGDNSLSRDQKLQKMRDLRQASIGKVRETLTTDEQKTKFDNMVQSQNQRIRESEQQQQAQPQQNSTTPPK